MKAPLLRSKNTTPRMMLNVVIALIPIIIFSTYKNGYIPYKNGYTTNMFYPLIFILISTLATFTFETIYQILFTKKSLKEIVCNSYAFMPGLFLGLILPINTPISILLVGCFASSIIAKMLFGGFGQNIFNPALVGRLIIISCYAMVITNASGYLNKYEVDTISSATPLSNASIKGTINYDDLVTPYGDLSDFFIGTIPGAIGETSALLCLIGLIYLAITKTIKVRIPLYYISTVFIMTFFIGNCELWYSIFAICSGGLMFGATFMATDPVTSPVTKEGQILYGLMLGLLTVIFRYLTPYPEGVLTSILTMNMLVFIVDKIGIKAKMDRKKIILPIMILLGLIILFTVVIHLKYNQVTEGNIDPNYSILNIEANGNEVKYTVTQKGYQSTIKGIITIKDGKVLDYEIKEQGDSFFSKVEERDYTKYLVDNQDKLDSIDTVSGATISSTAVLKMLVNTIDGYKNKNYLNFDGPKEEEKPADFEILETNGNIYKVKQKSFGGDMILNITIIDNKVSNIELVSYNDTCVSESNKNEYYECPEYLENGYISSLIENNDIDTVSGATISSTALKNAIKNTLEAINEG